MPDQTAHNFALHTDAVGVGTRAPIIRSSKPSPLTSPALLTDEPDWSPAAMPLIAKPLLPLRSPEVDAGTKATVAAKHYITLPCITDAVGVAQTAPIIRSSKPSPLMSPALLTDQPEKSPAAMPLIAKPLLPLRSSRLKLAPKPLLLPNTT